MGRRVAPTVNAGRKWKPKQAVQQAQSALKHRDIMDHVQHGGGGLKSGLNLTSSVILFICVFSVNFDPKKQ